MKKSENFFHWLGFGNLPRYYASFFIWTPFLWNCDIYLYIHLICIRNGWYDKNCYSKFSQTLNIAPHGSCTTDGKSQMIHECGSDFFRILNIKPRLKKWCLISRMGFDAYSRVFWIDSWPVASKSSMATDRVKQAKC